MTRRRLLVFGLVATVAVLVIGALLLWPPRTAITPENAKKIRDGMTLTEVEVILGGPARDEWEGPLLADLSEYTIGSESERPYWEKRFADDRRSAPRKAPGFRDWQTGGGFRLYGETHVWVSSQVVITVDLDKGGDVAWSQSLIVRPGPESPLDTIRRWLHL